jgi:hypothetical protein
VRHARQRRGWARAGAAAQIDGEPRNRVRDRGKYRGCVISDASATAIGAGATTRADGTGANAYAQAGGDGNCRAVGSSACEVPGNNFNVRGPRDEQRRGGR